MGILSPLLRPLKSKLLTSVVIGDDDFLEKLFPPGSLGILGTLGNDWTYSDAGITVAENDFDAIQEIYESHAFPGKKKAQATAGQLAATNVFEQLTASAKPTLLLGDGRGARNRFLHTEDITISPWDITFGCPNSTSNNIIADSTTALHYILQNSYILNGETYTQSMLIEAAGVDYFQLTGSTGFNSWYQNYDLTDGSLGNGNIITNGGNATIVEESPGIYRITYTDTAIATSATGRVVNVLITSKTDGRLPSWTGDDVSGVNVSELQLNVGATRDPYQHNESHLNGVGPGQNYIEFDGVQQNTAAQFAGGAGPSDASFIACINTSTLDGALARGEVDAKFIGLLKDASAATSFGNVGSPTVWVNGVNIGLTADDLHAAASIGDWVLIDYRNADFSGWSAFELANLAASMYDGGINQCFMIVESSDFLTDNRDKVYNIVAKGTGVTFPIAAILWGLDFSTLENSMTFLTGGFL